MRTSDEIRRARLAQLLELYESRQAFATAIGCSYTVVTQWLVQSKRATGSIAKMSSDTARKIEEKMRAAGHSHVVYGWMDNEPAYDVREPEGASPQAGLIARLFDAEANPAKRNDHFAAIIMRLTAVADAHAKPAAPASEPSAPPAASSTPTKPSPSPAPSTPPSSRRGK